MTMKAVASQFGVCMLISFLGNTEHVLNVILIRCCNTSDCFRLDSGLKDLRMSAYPKISKDVAYIDIDAAKIFAEMHKNICQAFRPKIFQS